MSDSRFNYLAEKISDAKFIDHPFKHIYIENFLSESDFKEIISAEEINLKKANSDEDLFNKLFEQGYVAIPFAGCTVNKKEYLRWHAGKKSSLKFNTACGGFGMALKLNNPKTEILTQIRDFIADDLFNQTISKKFDHDLENKIVDNGINKYLDGYEISPHPDIRKKAVTFMVNINPHEDAEKLEHHAHLLRLTPEREYITNFWQGNNNVDRCLIPWDWATVHKTQSKNNSLLLFSPSNDTLHAVKASYDHLNGQRTQLYGNIWHKRDQASEKSSWEDLDILEILKKQHKPNKSVEALKNWYQVA